MALDGFCFTALIRELNSQLAGSRVERICYVDNRIALRFRAPGRTLVLHCALFSPPYGVYLADADCRRGDNTAFSQLLHNHLAGLFCRRLGNPPFDRWATFAFAQQPRENHTAMHLQLELMGRQNHLTLVREGKVLATTRTGAVNQPGHRFAPPPATDKFDPRQLNPNLLFTLLQPMKDTDLAPALVKRVFGLGPLLASELAHRAGLKPDSPAAETDAASCEKLVQELHALAASALSGVSKPALYWEDSKLRAWYWQPLAHLDLTPDSRQTISEVIAASQDWHRQYRRLGEQKARLHTVLSRATARLERTLAKQQQELARARSHDRFRQWGDTLLANLQQIKRGQDKVRLINPHTGQAVEIPLNPDHTASENAARYYKKHSRLKNAAGKILRQMKRVKETLTYLDSLSYAKDTAADMTDVDEIFQEMSAQGLVHKQRQKPRPRPTEYVKLLTPAGDSILVGKNNRQNEQLTLRQAEKDHIWLHVRDFPGSHVVLCSPSPSQQSLLFAASVAAWYSRARAGNKVEVVWTQVKHVKKIPGGKPGMVTYTNYKSIIADPRFHLNADSGEIE